MQELTKQTIITIFDNDSNSTQVNLTGVSLQDSLFIQSWLHGRSKKTIQAYLADILRFYDCTSKTLQNITLGDFQDFINSLAHLSPASRARITASVKSALSFGLKTGYLQVNVGTVVKLSKLENKLAERIMSEQQVAKMFALEVNKRNHAILVLLYRAGLRVSELCSLTWRNLQGRSESGQVTIYGKGKKTRHVLLDQATWDEVMSLKTKESRPDDYVFQSGITGNISPHWFRHAHATHALERGAPITLVKATLGHESMETTAKYTHVRPNASSSQFLGV